MAQTQTFDRCMAGPSPAPRVPLVEGYVRSFHAWRKRRAEIAELRTLDDRLLHDMGIGRSEIDSLVHFAGRDPTRLPRG